jgi:hypothetical protein
VALVAAEVVPMRRWLLVPVVTLVVAGCGSGGGSSQLGSVTSAQQVITYMGKHGLPCTNPSQNTGVFFVREEYGCTLDGQDVTIDIWSSNSQIATTYKALSSLGGGPYVQGDKWTIAPGSDAEAHKIQKVTGGTVH